MVKYLKNGIAFIRGAVIRLITIYCSNKMIAAKVRVFASANLEIDNGAKISIGRGAKIRERSVISVRKNGLLEIGKNASVGMDCKLVVHEHVVIGDGTLLSPNVLIYDHDHVFDNEVGVHRKEFKSDPVIIGKNCWIGASTIILRGCVIGDNCLIGAGSIVKTNIPSGSVFYQKRENKVIYR